MWKFPFINLIGLLLLTSMSAPVLAADPFTETFGSIQPAGPNDIRIKEPFIGTFRGSTNVFDDGETEYHFVISYDWWGAEKNIVKYTVSMVIPSQDRTLVRSEGFYGFDPFTNRLYVFGVFSRGMTGRGFIGTFDHEAAKHEIWARSMDDQGEITWVKDGFEVIDEDRWRNRTLVRRGAETEWKQVHEDTYTRVGEPVDL